MEVGTVSVVSVVGMGVEVLPVGSVQRLLEGVLRLGLEDRFAVPGADLPSSNVLHQLALLVAVDTQLLQEFSVALGEQQRIKRYSGRSHLDHVSLDFFVIQIVKVEAGDGDSTIALQNEVN